MGEASLAAGHLFKEQFCNIVSIQPGQKSMIFFNLKASQKNIQLDNRGL